MSVEPVTGLPVTAGPDQVLNTPHGGQVRINADGTLTYTPAPGYTGPDAFRYTASDGTKTATAKVSVNVVNGPSLGSVIDGGGKIVTGERWVAISSATADGV